MVKNQSNEAHYAIFPSLFFRLFGPDIFITLFSNNVKD
jgi:hypothetical protein